VSRLPPKGHPRYDVIYADRAARQIGGLMVLLGVVVLPVVVFGSRTIEVLPLAATVSLVTVGATFFTLGELLRRRATLGPAYGLVAVSGLCVGACAVQGACAALGLSRYAPLLTCPSVFTFALTMPVLWHTLRAIRVMRRDPEQGQLGFSVLPPQPPIKWPTPTGAATPPQRTDTSR
jgi:hypothetical protein